MQPTDNQAKLRRFLEEALPAGDFEAFDEWIDPNVVLPSTDKVPSGKKGIEGLKEGIEIGQTALRYTVAIDDMICEGDRIAVRQTVAGKQIGELMGQPNLGRQFSIDEMVVAQFRNGKVIQLWRIADYFSMMQQLGEPAS